VSLFVVQYRYVDDPDRVQEVRPPHRAFLSELAERSVLLLAGPWGDEPAGAVLFVRAGSAREVAEVFDADPFVREGVVTERTIRPWSPFITPWTD
jgi:uncharacterized protein YciI